ncbi:nucleotide disphospho-sugar-binding domain-containing protein [Nonomuraea sp. NPDC048916]|uniref:nucleotide disphospho-sugar-binding domain-containing protein n=1 Tax=Nonomuraea sp. NPDC048916 TaxID=3154232 RepID=UPI0033CD355C
MRVLVTTETWTRLAGLVPLGWALRTAGHEVCVAVPPALLPAARGTGLPVAVVGQGGAEVAEVAEVAEAAEAAEVDAAALADFAARWKPGLVIWDADHFAGPLAAHAVGTAHVRVLTAPDRWGRIWTSPPGREDLARQLSAEAARFGASFSEDLVLGQATIDPLPSCLRLPLEGEVQVIRQVPYDGVAVAPGWLQRKPKHPRVCVTLTRPQASSTAAVLAAVAELDVDVVAVLDAAALPLGTRIPANVRLLERMSLTVLLPGCAALVHDGGSGTILAAMIYGVPQLGLATAVWGDSDVMAEIERSGAGLSGDAGALPEQITRLLEEPSIRDGAAGAREELSRRPSPHDIVSWLAKLAADPISPGGSRRP